MALAIATVNNTTPLARRLNSWLSSLRQIRNDGYGIRADTMALLAAIGFDPTTYNPATTPPTPESVAVAAAFGLPDASHLAAALAGMGGLAGIDFTTPLSRFTSPVG